MKSCFRCALASLLLGSGLCLGSLPAGAAVPATSAATSHAITAPAAPAPALTLGPAAAAAAPREAADPAGEAELQTLWEALWHQSGTPTRLLRWEEPLRVRLEGARNAAQREIILRSLHAVTAQAGLALHDVSEQPRRRANVVVQVLPDTALEDREPCVTQVHFRSETRIDSARIQMRSRDVARCAHHEAMHLMGVRGHPEGPSVLSYFPVRVDRLLPLDQVMLQAWYSPRMRAGMTPFESLAVLADAWVESQPERARAARTRDRFLAATLDQMRAYAEGRGDIPPIVRRSGKSTEEGIRHGRGEMALFLGLAYLQGAAGTTTDPAQARQWLQRAASAGNRPAQERLADLP